jgi:hypothetical protein
MEYGLLSLPHNQFVPQIRCLAIDGEGSFSDRDRLAVEISSD